MGIELQRLYRWLPDQAMMECFLIEVVQPLEEVDWSVLETVLCGAGLTIHIAREPIEKGGVIVGPLMKFETPDSSRTVDILHSCGLHKVRRVEVFRWYTRYEENNAHMYPMATPDRMTEGRYKDLPTSFYADYQPEPMRMIDVLGGGMEVLQQVNTEFGLAMDEQDMGRVIDLVRNDLKRNLTLVELFQMAQGGSDHCRHLLFNGIFFVDGKRRDQTLMQMIKAPITADLQNALSVFHDNSMVICGHRIVIHRPEVPGSPSKMVEEEKEQHIIVKVETHNHPTAIAPDPGAATGSGGEIRDECSTGRGSDPGGAMLGLCTADMLIPGFIQPWENVGGVFPDRLATAMQIVIQGSNGSTEYENCFGRPGLGGFWRTCDLVLPDDERFSWLKPVFSIAGIGSIDARHVDKDVPAEGMGILRLGGYAFNVGLGGGSASSMDSGQNTANLDFASVQRANAEMQRRVYNVIRAATEMGLANFIRLIHDQGAAGISNVLTEGMYPAGGRIDIARVNKGDPTLTEYQVWCAEYQEGFVILVHPEAMDVVRALCARENVPLEELGEITGDGRIVVRNGDDPKLLVDLPLNKILGKLPPKEFHFTSKERELAPLVLPDNLTVREALDRVLRLPSVASKWWMLHKLDRSVTGLVGQQPCCGSTQQPVCDYGIRMDSHTGLTGTVEAIGENAVRMIVDHRAGVRMAEGEAITNIAGALVEGGLYGVKVSANWMGPYKDEHEGARLFESVMSLATFQTALGGAQTGSGKDSNSMRADDGTGKYVKSPPMLQVTAAAPMKDIRVKATPDIKMPGRSDLWCLDIGEGYERMGGSALAQVFKQYGNQSPDVKASVLQGAFNAIQEMLRQGLVLAYHDRSDGGLIITLLEMAFAGNCGFNIGADEDGFIRHAITSLFNEELAMVFEVERTDENAEQIREIAKRHGVENILHRIGSTRKMKEVTVRVGQEVVLREGMTELRKIWHELTSWIERHPEQGSEVTALEEWENMVDPPEPQYRASFRPEPTALAILSASTKPEVCILSSQGSNSAREMAVAFHMAGFNAVDVMMSDLLEGRITLEQFKGIVGVGGFSFGDTTDAGSGWARMIQLNPKLREMFMAFLDRNDVFSLGVCNGAQMFPFLGYVPWRITENDEQPRFVLNNSRKFESRWVTLAVRKSPSLLLAGMEGSVLGAHVAHKEGRFVCPQAGMLEQILAEGLAPVVYTEGDDKETDRYPWNPNGSPGGIAGITSRDGRHLVMMPHTIDRSFLLDQWHWLPEDLRTQWQASPWLKIAQNARALSN